MTNETMIDCGLTAETIDAAGLLARVFSPSSGGVVSFSGTVRDHSRGRRVLELHYEAYPEMAEVQLRELAESAARQFELDRVILWHRTGVVPVGEAAVFIAVASAHRDAAFRGCRFLIDSLKESVPIWKKEVYEDGECWIEGESAREGG